VGVGGSGKQSLAKLAAFMSGCEVFEITLTRGYDEIMFREDLKQLYTLLGSDNKKVGQQTTSEALSMSSMKHCGQYATTPRHSVRFKAQQTFASCVFALC